MFTRGSFRYPYIVRLMGACSLLCLASVSGLGCDEGDDDGILQTHGSSHLFSNCNDWLLGSKFDPPWMTNLYRMFYFGEYGLRFLNIHQWYLYILLRILLVHVLASFFNAFSILVCKINHNINCSSNVNIIGSNDGIGNSFFCLVFGLFFVFFLFFCFVIFCVLFVLCGFSIPFVFNFCFF